MRIAVVSRIYRPEPSAASFFLGSVVDTLRGQGNKVTVLTVKPPLGLQEETKEQDVRTAPVLRDKNGYVRGYVQYMSFDIPLAFRLLFLKRPDVLLVEPPPTTGSVVRVICAIRRIPYVYDAADIWSDAASNETGSNLVIGVLRWLETFGLRGARRIVTISDGVRVRLQELGVKNPVTVTGFGADTETFRYEEATPRKEFVYAGSYSSWHGASIILDAFAAFLETHPDYSLRFIGNGAEREVLEAQAQELGITGSLSFEDLIPADQLRTELARATASIATLRPGAGYDYAFTTKAYSSLGSGCPVIFSGPGPTASFIESANQSVNAGYAVPYDAEALLAAMLQVASQPLTPAQRQALSTWTDENHSMRAVATRVAAEVTAAAR